LLRFFLYDAQFLTIAYFKDGLSKASALQLSKSGVCHSKLCVTLGGMPKAL